MSKFTPIRELKSDTEYSSKDYLVVFGEVFEKGYINGLIKEAKTKNINIIYYLFNRWPP